jgi:hypothetical protein
VDESEIVNVCTVISQLKEYKIFSQWNAFFVQDVRVFLQITLIWETHLAIINIIQIIIVIIIIIIIIFFRGENLLLKYWFQLHLICQM